MTPTPARPGRKPKPPEEKALHATFTLERHHIDKLKRLASHHKTSQSGMVQRLIDRAKDKQPTA